MSSQIVSNFHKIQGFVLLKKIGKAVIDRNVTTVEIKNALLEIRFSDDDYVVE